MRDKGLVWKKFLVIAATAFLLGLLPYMLQIITADAEAVDLGLAAERLLSRLAAFAREYVPHILAIYITATAAIIFLEERNPDRTILWLMTLAFLPVLGIILYVTLGPDMKRLKTRKLFRPLKSYPPSTKAWGHAPARVRKTSVLAYRNSSTDICEHCGVRLLVNGEETFRRIETALSKAERYINIEYFIFKDDRLGREIAGILTERSRAGVRVRMAVDGVGSRRIGRGLKKELERAGVEVRTFMPVSFPALRNGLNFRNHRKIVVVDGDIAFTGGLNVGTEYLGEGPLGPWRDTHAEFTGDAVRALNAIFLSDWEICSGQKLSADSPEFAPSRQETADGASGCLAQIVPGGSGQAWNSIEQIYFMMISESRERIWITTPYLVPSEAILEALKVAALAGIDVRLLIPAKCDHFLSFWAGNSNIEDLIRSGARVWRYKKGFVHAKTLLMDDAIGSVGTANLDNRSLQINFEVQAFIYDAGICADLAAQFLDDLDDAEECSLKSWEKRPLRHRLLESVGRLWSSQV
ncbi:MAG: cardiolipin synthase [Synergistaceae bacterium]|jgi:cardiolipin synthase|nr:cardiolipin synthase [Synergistaceae bacterium]